MAQFMLVGDVHGCYYTLKELLDQHWDRDAERLIFLGDLVNKGKHSRKVLRFLMDLTQRFPQKVLVLKGNNEVLFWEKYHYSYANKGVRKFEKSGLNKQATLNWVKSLPHFLDGEHFFISHAGIPKKHALPLMDDDDVVLFNRKPLKNIGKTQFLGHIVVDAPFYSQKENAWFLDTGAGYGHRLSALKIQSDAQVLSVISLTVDSRDVKKANR